MPVKFISEMLTFGQYKGLPLAEIPPSYLRWVLTSDGVKAEVVAVIKVHLASIRELDEDFTFGKYKGLRLREVIAKDPDYIKWLRTNLNPRFKDGARIYCYLKYHYAW